MKIRYPAIGLIALFIISIISQGRLKGDETRSIIALILLLLMLVCLGLIVCLLLRNLFRAIKGQIGKKDR